MSGRTPSSYLRLEDGSDLDEEHDIVVCLTDRGQGTVAWVHHPIERNRSEDMSVPDALRLATDQVDISPGSLRLVVLDEEDLWQPAWGALVEGSRST